MSRIALRHSLALLAGAIVTTVSCSDAATASHPADSAAPAVTWSLAKAPGNNGDSQSDTVLTLITPLQVVVHANDALAKGVQVNWQVSFNGVDVGTLASFTNQEGIASFQFSLGPQTGAFTVVAALAPTPGAPPLTFNLTATPGNPALIIAVSGADQTDSATARLRDDDVARVIDRHGNGISGIDVRWDVTSGGGSISSTSGSTSGANGLTSARLTLGQAAGPNVVTATAKGIVASVAFQATATAASPTQFVIVSGNNQTALTGQALNADDVVAVTDSYGNPAAGVVVTWEITDGGGSLSTNRSVTAADGTAAIRPTLGSVPGTQTVVATASALTSALHVSFSATAMAPPL